MQERNVMAKFLPFVVEKSTPIHIFQTLITRSKGMNEVLVASMLYLVVEKGIKQVRETASKIPDMDLDNLYETLLTQYPHYRITNEQFSKIQSVAEHFHMWYPGKISAELTEYNLSDRMSFLLVMSLTGKLKEYTSLRFDLLYTDAADEILNNLIDLDLFSSDGHDYFFKSKEDLKAFIWCHELLVESPDERLIEPVNAVYSPVAEGQKYNPTDKYRNSYGWEDKTKSDRDDRYREAKEAYQPYNYSEEPMPSSEKGDNNATC